jgi:hypothetical protein
MQSNDSLVIGSLLDMAQKNGQSLAESFLGCDAIVLVDTSGSMSATDSRGGRSRYDVACDELRALQGSLPGKIAVLSFSNTVEFCPSGVAVFMGSNTNMERALKFAKVADVPGVRFILISDGEPDNPEATLAAAKMYKSRIDTIFVGPENDLHARSFLDRLAQASGGQTVTADRAMELKAGIETLLLKAKS